MLTKFILFGFIFKLVIPRSYYILAVSPELVRLYKVENKEISRVRSFLLPDNIYSALWMDDQEKSVQYHSISPTGLGRGTVFHGQGDIKDAKKTRLARFLNTVDDNINKIIKDKTKPLVLVCDKSLYPIFKRISDYPLVESKFVHGNPDRLKRADLVSKIRELYALK